MINNLVLALSAWILLVISKLSYIGIIILMAIESCNIPLPSEVIMPFAGYLVYLGEMNIHIAALAGACGCLLGSIISYFLGYYGGRPFLEKYGKYLLLTRHDLDVGDRLFAKYGDKIALVARVLPVIRTFISFPAGVTRMNVKKFMIYTFIGSWIWSYILLYVGIKVGKHRDVISLYFHKFDIAIVIIVVIILAYYIYTHVKNLKESI